MTLHFHKVDDRTRVEDGSEPVNLPEGWEIAAGDVDDIRVCAAHPWQSSCLVFANGSAYGTAMCYDSLSSKTKFDPTGGTALIPTTCQNNEILLIPANRDPRETL
jgi:hypothetical protein